MREARERAQFWLAFASMLIWFVVSFGLVLALDLAHRGRPALYLVVGTVALGVAALPWLAYPWLVKRMARGRTGE